MLKRVEVLREPITMTIEEASATRRGQRQCMQMYAGRTSAVFCVRGESHDGPHRAERVQWTVRVPPQAEKPVRLVCNSCRRRNVIRPFRLKLILASPSKSWRCGRCRGVNTLPEEIVRNRTLTKEEKARVVRANEAERHAFVADSPAEAFAVAGDAWEEAGDVERAAKMREIASSVEPKASRLALALLTECTTPESHR